jgi:hypothetical protein
MKRLLMSTIVVLFVVSWLALRADNQSKTQAARHREEVTFSKQVVRLMQQHCQRCHHPGGSAPFSLMTFEEAYPYARAIRSAVQSRRMPHGVNGTRLENGCGNVDTFEGPRRLLDSEIATFVEWVNGDMPEGDRRDLPPPMTFDNDGHGHDDPTSLYYGWRAGEPDLKIDNGPNGFNVPARLNKDFFRRFPIKTDFETDRFFTTFEAQVGTGDLGRQINVVHHVTLFIDPTCGSLEQEKAFAASNPEIPGAGFEGEMPYAPSLVGMWFPGANPIMLQDGIGIRVPKGACLIMEVHYTTWQDVVVPDKTAIGIRWARTPVYKERISARVNNENFVIPAGAKHYEVNATKTINEDFTIYSMAPHMHQFGVDISTEALLPNGEKKCLIDVEYDFKHQANYLLKQPITLPAGTTLKVRAFYDNTADFPRQLNHPPIDIPFGPVSDKEMCQNVIGLTYDRQQLHPSSPTIARVRVSGESLIVNGGDLRPGAFIEINDRLLADTQLGARGAYAVSPADWQEFAAETEDCCCASKAGAAYTAITNPLSTLLNLAVPQWPAPTVTCNCGGTCGAAKPMKIAIVNPDGGRTRTVPFVWRDIQGPVGRTPQR